MIDIQMVACFNICSPILHLFLPIQCQIHNTMGMAHSLLFAQNSMKITQIIQNG